MFLRVLFLFLAYILMGAHFLRVGSLIPTIVLAILPLTIFLKKKIVLISLQAGLVIGGLFIWLPTMINIAQIRMVMGEPWIRMALILSGVILFNLTTAWFIRGIPVKE